MTKASQVFGLNAGAAGLWSKQELSEALDDQRRAQIDSQTSGDVRT